MAYQWQPSPFSNVISSPFKPKSFQPLGNSLSNKKQIQTLLPCELKTPQLKKAFPLFKTQVSNRKSQLFLFSLSFPFCPTPCSSSFPPFIADRLRLCSMAMGWSEISHQQLLASGNGQHGRTLPGRDVRGVGELLPAKRDVSCKSWWEKTWAAFLCLT